jgi:L-iditol 2-dehydrogenase
MGWYMDAKAPHVLGHEVCGSVLESGDPRFPAGTRIAPHHHAACGSCPECRAGREVHCPQWRPNRITPGGMAERFAVSPGGLDDAHRVGEIRAVDAALAEPLACVEKSIERLGTADGPAAVVGLGALGIAHMLLLPGAAGYDPNPARRAWATNLGLDARPPEAVEPARRWVVCPGSEDALRLALSHCLPDATVLLFAPMPPGREARAALHEAYFLDVSLVSSYSCGPRHMEAALRRLAAGEVRAEQIVSHFVGVRDVPQAYEEMRAGTMLKAMAVFP